MKPQVYKDPRPAEHFDRFHERAAQAAARLDVRARAAGPHALPAARSSARAASTRTRSRRDGAGDRRAEPLLVPRPLLRGRLPAPQGALHGEVAALQAAAAVHLHARRRLPGAARPRATRRRSRPPTRSSPAATSSSCTPRAAARAPASSARPRRHRPAGARDGRAGRADRDRRAPRRRATGSGCQFPKVTRPATASRSASSRSRTPTREQSQAASEVVFAEIKKLHARLRAEGRRSAVRAARAARRAAEAAEAAGRRPLTH